MRFATYSSIGESGLWCRGLSSSRYEMSWRPCGVDPRAVVVIVAVVAVAVIVVLVVFVVCCRCCCCRRSFSPCTGFRQPGP